MVPWLTTNRAGRILKAKNPRPWSFPSRCKIQNLAILAATLHHPRFTALHQQQIPEPTLKYTNVWIQNCGRSTAWCWASTYSALASCCTWTRPASNNTSTGSTGWYTGPTIAITLPWRTNYYRRITKVPWSRRRCASLCRCMRRSRLTVSIGCIWILREPSIPSGGPSSISESCISIALRGIWSMRYPVPSYPTRRPASSRHILRARRDSNSKVCIWAAYWGHKTTLIRSSDAMKCRSAISCRRTNRFNVIKSLECSIML